VIAPIEVVDLENLAVMNATDIPDMGNYAEFMSADLTDHDDRSDGAVTSMGWRI
jgi:hypothetical protein